jgi:hypothetical protein
MQSMPAVVVGKDKAHEDSITKQHSSPMKNRKGCLKSNNASIAEHKDICQKTAQRRERHHQYYQLGPQWQKHRQSQHQLTRDLLNQGMKKDDKGIPSI